MELETVSYTNSLEIQVVKIQSTIHKLIIGLQQTDINH